MREFQILNNLTIHDAASDGRGVARHENRVIFVEGAIPGDVVQAKVVQKEKKALVAIIDALLSPSPHRVAPVCSHFGFCGGCKWQQMAYPAQLNFKQKQVTDALERIGGVQAQNVFPILAAPTPLHYRNKLEFTFSNRRWRTTEEMRTNTNQELTDALGFHVPRYYDKVIDIQTCYLQRPEINLVRNRLAELARQNKWDFYDIKAQTGLLRNLVFRTTRKEMMLLLLLGNDAPDLAIRICETLTTEFPFITSFLWAHNPKKNDSYSDLVFKSLKGPAYLTEQLGAYTFEIGPTSFFQTNTEQAERLYQVIYDFMGEKVDNLMDLYCGTGTISIYASDKARHITGIEYVLPAVQDAARNAEKNNLQHLQFFAADMQKLSAEDLLQKAGGKPDIIITDPPRAGMEGNIPEKLLQLAPNKIIYVSCNPATQARDLQVLSRQYTLQAIQPVDMFPQTTHVENVALLIKNESL